MITLLYVEMCKKLEDYHNNTEEKMCYYGSIMRLQILEMF